MYIGISGNLKRRWKEHINADSMCTYLHKAIKKYGKDNFKFDHIADAFNWKDACQIEKDLIKELNTCLPNGYNLTLGGDGTLGFKHSDEERQRRSDRCPTRNPEILKLISDKQRGVKRPHMSGIKNAMFGRTGVKSHLLKNIIIATNLSDGKSIELAGAKEIELAGFNRSHVYGCINNKRNTHKNHIFKFKEK